jgi:hypothetical protein
LTHDSLVLLQSSISWYHLQNTQNNFRLLCPFVSPQPQCHSFTQKNPLGAIWITNYLLFEDIYTNLTSWFCKDNQSFLPEIQ